MAGTERRLVEASSSRTRPRSPERFERNVRQKTDREIFPPPLNRTQGSEDQRDEELDTALAHVIYDSPDHPIYRRHVDYVLRRMCTNLSEAMRQSLASLQNVSSTGAAASEAKRAAAKQLLTERWLGTLLEHVGEIMVATDQEGVVVENDLGRHRLQLKIVPIVQVDDGETVVSEGSRVPERIRDLTKDDDKATGEDESDEQSADEEDKDASGAGEGSDDDDDTENSGSGSDDNSEEESEDETDEHSDDGSSEDETISDSDADQEDSGVDIPPHLQTYRPGRTQVFVCNHVPKGIPSDSLLEELATTVRRLDRITKVLNFTVHHNAEPLHFGPYFGKAKCRLCGVPHFLVDCARLAPLIPQKKSHKNIFMITRPRLLCAFKR